MSTPNTPDQPRDEQGRFVADDAQSVDELLGLPADDLSDFDRDFLQHFADRADATVEDAASRLAARDTGEATGDTAPSITVDDPTKRVVAESAARGVAADGAPGTPEPSPEAHTQADVSADDAGTPSDEGASAPGAPLNINYGGRTYAIDDAVATQLLDQAAWVASKPDAYWQVMHGIEQGDVVALTREDYDALLRAAQGPSLAPSSEQPAIKKVDPNASMDPELAQAFNALVDRVNALPARDEAPVQPGGPGGAAPRPFDPRVAQAQTAAARQQAANEAIIEDTLNTYASKYGLNDGELDALMEHTLSLQLVPRLSGKYTRVAPDGTVLAGADMRRVYTEAFDAALSSHPTLRQKYIDTLAAERVANDAALNATVNAKKRRSASLASVPSAASATPNRDPKTMSPQEREAAIADFLRREMAS